MGSVEANRRGEVGREMKGLKNFSVRIRCGALQLAFSSYFLTQIRS